MYTVHLDDRSLASFLCDLTRLFRSLMMLVVVLVSMMMMMMMIISYKYDYNDDDMINN